MGLVNILSDFFSNGALIGGVLLLAASCIFAFVDFYKNKYTTTALWRVLSGLSFVLGIVLSLGIIIYSTWGTYCRGSNSTDINRKLVENISNIELNER
ncbi:virion membrane protein A14 [BeAn 58058 virus]|uniref:virion membrane protein A14 n=1 Tax=BeAn 58058 virus TaxID=67082 RepID=UPI00090C330F|nr:virion membrane protein A14 [BeAn 58058 virus]APG58323.1 virion membrane protein A14 [BeAn 58058 virus]